LKEIDELMILEIDDSVSITITTSTVDHKCTKLHSSINVFFFSKDS